MAGLSPVRGRGERLVAGTLSARTGRMACAGRRLFCRRRGRGGEEGGGVVAGEPAHEEVGGLEFGFADALAVAFGDGDQRFAGLGDDEEGLEELFVAGGEAAVLEGVEVAFRGAGAGAGAASAGFGHGGHGGHGCIWTGFGRGFTRIERGFGFRV